MSNQTHNLKLNAGPYKSVAAGTKTIEMRLMDEKRKNIKVGDTIIFTHREDSSQSVVAKVIALHPFKTFDELYKNFDKVALGYKKDEDAKPEDMTQYYPQEEIDLYGVVGIEIKLI